VNNYILIVAMTSVIIYTVCFQLSSISAHIKYSHIILTRDVLQHLHRCLCYNITIHNFI